MERRLRSKAKSTAEDTESEDSMKTIIFELRVSIAEVENFL
jgi:hypothetical protein